MTFQIRMPFEGIASFLGTPLIDNTEKLLEMQVAFAGIPYDMGTTNRAGARLGPRAIRDASQFYTYFKTSGLATVSPDKAYEGLWDINRKKPVLVGTRIGDVGDVCVIPANVQKSFDKIEETAAWLIKNKVFPVFVGGDHSITYPLLKACSNTGTIHVIHFDTHIDTWENVGGAEMGHGSPLFLAQKSGTIKTITHIGLHGFLNDEDRYTDAIEKGHTIITADDIHDRKNIDYNVVLPKDDVYYLTFDIDVCDPAYAPGTGTPEFGGLSPVQIFNLIDTICTGRRFIGMDLVEVNPLYDHSQITAILAVQIILKILNSIKGSRL